MSDSFVTNVTYVVQSFETNVTQNTQSFAVDLTYGIAQSGGSALLWGAISGNIADQTDLVGELARLLGTGDTAANSLTLNGQSGSYYLDYANFTGIPTGFVPSFHYHNISDVSGLQAALDNKLDSSLTGSFYPSDNPSGYTDGADRVPYSGATSDLDMGSHTAKAYMVEADIFIGNSASQANLPYGIIVSEGGGIGESPRVTFHSNGTYAYLKAPTTLQDQEWWLPQDGGILATLNDVSGIDAYPNTNPSGYVSADYVNNLTSNLVYTTGSQTVSGQKTFADSFIGSGTGNRLPNQTALTGDSILTRTLAAFENDMYKWNAMTWTAAATAPAGTSIGGQDAYGVTLYTASTTQFSGLTVTAGGFIGPMPSAPGQFGWFNFEKPMVFTFRIAGSAGNYSTAATDQSWAVFLGASSQITNDITTLYGADNFSTRGGVGIRSISGAVSIFSRIGAGAPVYSATLQNLSGYLGKDYALYVSGGSVSLYDGRSLLGSITGAPTGVVAGAVAGIAFNATSYSVVSSTQRRTSLVNPKVTWDK